MADKRFVATKVEVEGREETRIVEVPPFEPAPWTEDAVLDVVGCSIPRSDALEKVTGRAKYTVDVQRARMLFAAPVRTSVAHGRVVAIDPAPALAMPGVEAVLLRDEMEGIRHDGGQVFDQTIRYAGQAVAAVCASTFDLAKRAARAVIVKVEAAPHAVTAEAALRPEAPRVRPKGNLGKTSPRVVQRGEPDAALSDADVVIEREYRTPVALHTCMETHAAVAEWLAEQVTVWESTQGIFNTREDLADAFGLKHSQVRVIKDYMGGGFGSKNGASQCAYIAVALARKTGRPVRCAWDREGEQLDSGNRPATTQRVRLGAKRDGTLTAIVLDATIQMGVGGWFAGPGKIYHELYACPDVRTTETFVYTHTGAMSSFRAPGHVEGAFGLECAMDALARELGMDPLELRRKNYATRDQEKNRRYSAKRLDECYRAGAERFGWDTFSAGAARRLRSRPALRAGFAGRTAEGGRAPIRATGAGENRYRRGRGMASVSWGAGGGPPAYAAVRVNPDGTVEVLTGSQDLGTGARTVFTQIAAEAIGADVADVSTILGDTERLPYTGNSWGSQTTASVGPAVRMAAEEARKTLLQAASALLDVPVEELECRNSRVFVRNSPRAENRPEAPVGHTPPGWELSFAEIGEKLGDVMIIGQGMRGPNPENTAMTAFGAQFAEVEVDTETGQVRVLRIVAAHDSGRIINPRLAESQLEGGILQGVGFALFEERVLDERLGVPLNPTMHDYKVPTMADVPAIEAFFVPGADTVANHIGVKGVGEPPIIGIAPAIANAVADAIGVEVSEIPLTPWRILQAVLGGDRDVD